MTWIEGKYLPDPESGCWVWQRARQARGYGVVWYEGKLHLAHRVAWHLRFGAWPSPGLVLDHVCNNKACVNPEHLRELTNSDNILRAIPRGDDRTEAQRAIWREQQARHRAALERA